MKICFFTENGFIGKVPRNYENMRTDTAWMCALNADHCPIANMHNCNEKYDLGIIIIPKLCIPLKNHVINKAYLEYPIIDHLKRLCKKYAVMQESTFWYWQDATIDLQLWFYNIHINADFLFCHNHDDINYFKGITDKNTYILQSTMITDYVVNQNFKKPGVVIGGNFSSIYRGFDSFIVAQTFVEQIYAPSTGRKRESESLLPVTHLPWMDWLSWMKELSTFKWTVQLGTPAAGTFNMNSSYFGIPCVGYENLYTQKILHPRLSVKEGDVYEARKLASRLLQDVDFYKSCCEETKDLYNSHFTEQKFIEKTIKIIENELK